MQDIRKPYSHSRSNRDIEARVEALERRKMEELDDTGAVHIPIRAQRHRRNLDAMEMYPRKRQEHYEEIEEREFERPYPDEEIDTDPYTPYREVRRRGSERNFGTWTFIAATVVLVGGIGLLTFVFNSATITFVPKYKDVDVSKNFLFSKNETPGAVTYTLATTTLSKTKTLPLSQTKKVESKAYGDIIVYNNFDTNPQKLIKNTRFESSDGKIFRINQSITVPGKHGDTPGSLQVTVYADSYGAEYNIAPSDFTIPGFKGTPRYNGFYARSVGSMKGGSSGDMALVSQSDLDAAKDELALEIKQNIKDSMQKIEGGGNVPLYNDIAVVFTDNEDKVMTGQTSTYEITGTGYLILARDKELAQVIAQEAVRDYAGQPVKLDYAKNLSFTLKKDADPSKDETLDILVEGKPRIVYVTNIDTIKDAFLGKNRSDAPKILENIPSISQIEMSFFPLWLSSIPTNKDRISVVESLPKR